MRSRIDGAHCATGGAAYRSLSPCSAAVHVVHVDTRISVRFNWGHRGVFNQIILVLRMRGGIELARV